MGGELLYLDSSALVKLVLPEAESDALSEVLAAWPIRVTSELARIELIRATRRATSHPATVQRAEEVLAGLHLLRLEGEILGEAARLEPWSLRSLDAIHLASALSLGTDLGAIVIYDSKLASAAALHTLLVLSPGQASPA